MFLINGHAQDQLAVSDRATQFGDGSFTTARIVDGNICHLEAHLQRLQVACEKLRIAFSHWATLRQEMTMLATGHDSGVLKVIISRGSGAMGIQRHELSGSYPNPLRFCLSRLLFSVA